MKGEDKKVRLRRGLILHDRYDDYSFLSSMKFDGFRKII